jgi:hypothetical protein
MLTFREYLTHINEKFLRGATSRAGGREAYGEVYVNPTPDEMRAGGTIYYGSIPSVYGEFGQPCYFVGAWLTNQSLVIWDRNKLMHSDVMRDVPELHRESLALYIYYFPKSNTCAIDASGFSKAGRYMEHSDLALAKRAARHPGFSKFNVVTRDHDGFGAKVVVLK